MEKLGKEQSNTNGYLVIIIILVVLQMVWTDIFLFKIKY
jgi:hypothetical protein